MSETLFIDTPRDFSFKACVYSHGWSELAPFALDETNWRLSYVFQDGKRAVSALIFEENGRLRIDLENSKIDTAKIIEDVRHLLRLDDDLSGFYDVIRQHDRLKWVRKYAAGRLMRSPTVWEDLVKTICTTNCSWSLTKIMVTNLVEKLGVNAGKGKKAFPRPEALAAMPESFYRNEIRCGYRSPYFIELAEKVAYGKLDLQSWLNSELPTPELKKQMKSVKGVGDYAAENLLKLVGRYDGLALDSWLRSQFYKIHNKEKVCTDKRIERHYKKFGEWRGLVIWCDMTERWFR